MAVDSVQILDTVDAHMKTIKVSGSGDIAIRIFLDGTEMPTVWHNLTISPYQTTVAGLDDGNHQVCAQQM